mmetsp:Transcript_4792/g.17947  ORF Transcript_4792/g.17947 Transcript_4792/m.17947 type:complete len:643 (-) Transcript_4792:107-2035(-)
MYYSNGYHPSSSSYNASNLVTSQIMSDAHEAYMMNGNHASGGGSGKPASRANARSNHTQQQHYANAAHHPNAPSTSGLLMDGSHHGPPHHHVLYTKTETVSVASNHALKLDRLYGAEPPRSQSSMSHHHNPSSHHHHHHNSSANKHNVQPRSQSSMGGVYGSSGNSARKHQSKLSNGSGSSRNAVAYKPFSTNFKKWIPKYPYHRSMKKVFSKFKPPQASTYAAGSGRKSKVRLFHSPSRSGTPTSSHGMATSNKYHHHHQNGSTSKRKTKNRRQVYAVDSNSYFMDNNLMMPGDEELMAGEMSSGLNVSGVLNTSNGSSHHPHSSANNSIIMNSSYQHPAQYKMRDLPPRSHTDLGMSSARSVSSRNSRKGRKKKKRGVFSRGGIGSRKQRVSSQRPTSRATSSMGHYASTGSTRSTTPSSSGHNGSMSKGQRSVSSTLRGTPTHIRLENQMGRSFLKGKSFGKSGTPSTTKPPSSSNRPTYYSSNHGNNKPPSSKYQHRMQVGSNGDTYSQKSSSSSRSNQENNYANNQQQKTPAAAKPTIQAKPRRSSVALEQTMEATFESLNKYKFGDQDDSYTNYNGVDLHIDLVMYQFFVSSTTERYRQFDLVEKMVEQVPNLDKIGKGIDIESIKRKMRQLAENS